MTIASTISVDVRTIVVVSSKCSVFLSLKTVTFNDECVVTSTESEK